MACVLFADGSKSFSFNLVENSSIFSWDEIQVWVWICQCLIISKPTHFWEFKQEKIFTWPLNSIFIFHNICVGSYTSFWYKVDIVSRFAFELDYFSFGVNFAFEIWKYLSDELVMSMKRQVWLIKEKSKSSVVSPKNIEHQLILKSGLQVLVKVSWFQNMFDSMCEENLELLSKLLKFFTWHFVSLFCFSNPVQVVEYLFSAFRVKLT